MSRLKRTSAIFVLLAALFALSSQANAETAAKMDLSQQAPIVIVQGTSTIHDWSVQGNEIQGDVQLARQPAGTTLENLASVLKAENQIQLSVTIPVKSLSSGKDAMDEKMYEALKIDDHPTITFKSERILDAWKESEDTLVVQLTGQLEIAGTSRSTTLMARVRQDSNNAYGVELTKKINMTEFEIDPPRAMFGTIRTGEDVTVHVGWQATPEIVGESGDAS